MKNLTVEFDGNNLFTEKQVENFKKEGLKATKTLLNGTGEGNDFIGWVNLPVDYDKEEFDRIKKAAEKIRSDSDALVVCGIGGSYLGAAAAVDFLKGSLNNLRLSEGKNEGDPKIYFAGNNMSPSYVKDILDLVKDKDFSVNVISKSGTTMETSISFRIFKKALEDKYGKEEAAKRIYATTDKERGALKDLADKEGYEEFVVPDNVGGRFSVLTAVGLLPIAAAGCDIDALMKGAADLREELLANPENDAFEYAINRQLLYSNGKAIEILANYDPDLRLLGEWFKQLFGESEGKEGFGIFPASVNFTSDLHSMGQMIQDGERNIFETVVNVEKEKTDLPIPGFEEDFDGFKYLEGKQLDLLNQAAVEGVEHAHVGGGVPQVYIGIPDKSEYTLGQLFYFFEYSCGISAYIEGVNPFNQPGVEEYKKNIKEILAKYKEA